MPTLRLRPDLEEALSRIQGVRAASVVTLANGEPTEIHVLAAPGKHAKQVVRDVQSLAMAQFGMDLDHRIVSVVQLDDAALATTAPPSLPTGSASADIPHDAPLPPTPEPMSAPPAAAHAPPEQVYASQGDTGSWREQEVIDLRDREPVALSVVGSDHRGATAGPAAHPQATARVMLLPEALAAEAVSDDDPAPRPAIASIMVRTSNGESEATVAVGAGGHMFEGRFVGPAGATHRPRLVAQATLAAVADLLGQTAEIESAQLVTSAARQVAITVLTVQTPRIGEQVMSGSAVVRGDEADAVARSVLDALNRRISG